jgi:hypothetical protein
MRIYLSILSLEDYSKKFIRVPIFPKNRKGEIGLRKDRIKNYMSSKLEYL